MPPTDLRALPQVGVWCYCYLMPMHVDLGNQTVFYCLANMTILFARRTVFFGQNLGPHKRATIKSIKQIKAVPYLLLGPAPPVDVLLPGTGVWAGGGLGAHEGGVPSWVGIVVRVHLERWFLRLLVLDIFAWPLFKSHNSLTVVVRSHRTTKTVAPLRSLWSLRHHHGLWVGNSHYNYHRTVALKINCNELTQVMHTT